MFKQFKQNYQNEYVSNHCSVATNPIFRCVSIIRSQNVRVRYNDLSSTEFQSSSISCPGCILVDVAAGSSIKCAHLCSATGCFASLRQKPLLPQQMRNRFFMSPPSDASRHPCSSAWRGPGPFLQTKIASRAAASSPGQPSPGQPSLDLESAGIN